MADDSDNSLAGDCEKDHGPLRLFSIPAGAEFIPEFVTALLGQKIVPGFPAAGDPLALSSARIFVPTRRAARAMASEIARQLGASSAILPQILPLGSLAEAEEASLFDPVSYAGFAAIAAQEAMPELERRLLLTELIIAWGKQIRHAILSVDENGRIIKDEQEAFIVTSAPGQAFHLAGELCALIDEMIIEDVDWRALSKLAPENFDRYWSITLEFLKIAMEHWPSYLEQRGCIDTAERNVQLAAAEGARLLQTRPSDPYIVAGSTGTNAATAQLMAAIARLPNGAVVLPGLDHALDEEAWSQLAKKPDTDGTAGHPQKALANLLARLRAVRDDVRNLGTVHDAVAGRMEFLTQALLPAEATDRWNDYRKNHDDADMARALAGISYIDAANERQEALAIAIALRQALETQGRTAALITPDRDLARRVRSELLRWNVVVDDSGGEVLKNQPAGVLARIALELALGVFGNDTDTALSPSDPAVLVALFNHDQVRLGYDPAVFARIAQVVECGMIRGPHISLRDPQRAVAIARTLAEDIHAHQLKKSIDDQGWSEAAGFLQKLKHALSPLTGSPGSQTGSRPLGEWFSALRAVYLELVRDADGEPLAGHPDAQALEVLFDAFIRVPDTSLRLTLDEFSAFFDTASQETRVRGPQNAHPRIKILGLLEARLLPADMKILAGMDEGVWPPAARGDAFLNRPMREELGLSPPERRIGQTAHDFVEAMGAADVIITRSRKRDGAPAIPSRLIQRISALAGETAWDQCRERGGILLRLADGLDRSAAVLPAPRPAPRPAVELRPHRLSVTQIETWRRDPYSIYASRILRLQPLEEAGADKVNAEIGTLLHAAIEQYQTGGRANETLPQAQARIQAIAEVVFADLLGDINVRTFRWPRILTALESFVAWEMARRDEAESILIEQSGRMEIVLADKSTFTLTARADRVEKLRNGGAALADYKSARTPSVKVMEAGFAPQLTLEAAIVEAGGFDCLPAGTPVEDALYLALLGADGVAENIVGKGKNVTKTLDDLKRDHLQGLITLANQFRQIETAYVPRPYPQFINEYGDYDHLARVKEWMGEADGDDA